LGAEMRKFDYNILQESSWDSEIVSFIEQIREHKGKQDL
jgi:hypothetical protein